MPGDDVMSTMEARLIAFVVEHGHSAKPGAIDGMLWVTRRHRWPNGSYTYGGSHVPATMAAVRDYLDL
jgi:hypothetical protein